MGVEGDSEVVVVLRRGKIGGSSRVHITQVNIPYYVSFKTICYFLIRFDVSSSPCHIVRVHVLVLMYFESLDILTFNCVSPPEQVTNVEIFFIVIK